MTITQETIDAIRSKLVDLPSKPKTDITLRDLVKELAPDLRAAMNLGYSLTDLREMLKTDGVTSSISTLGSYLRASAKSAAPKPRENAPRSRAGRAEIAPPRVL